MGRRYDTISFLSDLGTALWSGATWVAVDRARIVPGPRLVSLLDEKRITHLDIPPSCLALARPEAWPPSLRVLVAGRLEPQRGAVRGGRERHVAGQAERARAGHAGLLRA